MYKLRSRAKVLENSTPLHTIYTRGRIYGTLSEFFSDVRLYGH